MDQEKVGKFLAECRKRKNITQAQLEQIIGVDRRTISKWEKGLVGIDVKVLEKLAEALDVSVVELLRGERLEVRADGATALKSRFKNKKWIASFVLVEVFIALGIFLYTKSYYSFSTQNILFYKDGYQINGKIIDSKNQKQVFINKFVYNNAYSASEGEIMTNKVKVTLYYRERELFAREFVLEDGTRDAMSNIVKNMSIDYLDEKGMIKSIDDLNLIVEYLDSNDDKQYMKIYLQTF